LPFAFLFSTDLLKKDGVEAFNAYLISQGWMRFLRFLQENDSPYLEAVAARNANTQQAIHDFCTTGSIEWWTIEPDLAAAFDAYSGREARIRDIVSFKKTVQLPSEAAIQYIEEHYYEDPNHKKIEIVSHKALPLRGNLVGIYVQMEQLHLVKSLLPAGIPLFVGATRASWP
jgi:hypothetical protein